MIKVFILVVYSSVYSASGSIVTFQEFNSLKSCEANVKFLKQLNNVRYVYCTEK